MFEDLIKTLEKLEQTKQVSIPIETDEKGYIDKQCPAEECEFIFKVHQHDWANIVKDEAVWCPFCRHEAPADQWYTVEQVEHGKSEALSVIKGEIHNAIVWDAQKFNRKQSKGGFVSISMKVSGGQKRTQPIPAKAAESMQLEITCEECNTRFSVIGSAYFCPACGHNSVERTFRDSLKKINDTMGHSYGDLVLQEIASSIKSTIRQTDYAIRWGGDEFLILLRNTDYDNAEKVVKRIDDRISASSDGRFSVSYGVEAVSEYTTTYNKLIETADIKMYANKYSKRRG